MSIMYHVYLHDFHNPALKSLSYDLWLTEIVSGLQIIKPAVNFLKRMEACPVHAVTGITITMKDWTSEIMTAQSILWSLRKDWRLFHVSGGERVINSAISVQKSYFASIWDEQCVEMRLSNIVSLPDKGRLQKKM